MGVRRRGREERTQGRETREKSVWGGVGERERETKTVGRTGRKENNEERKKGHTAGQEGVRRVRGRGKGGGK
jgi:hypothetical protein